MGRAEFQLYDGTIVKSPFWWARFWRSWHFGRAYRYPACCVFRFSVDQALARGCSVDRGIRYRTASSSGDDHWVPCGVFHRSEAKR
jgi:hypothetical protein